MQASLADAITLAAAKLSGADLVQVLQEVGSGAQPHSNLHNTVTAAKRSQRQKDITARTQMCRKSKSWAQQSLPAMFSCRACRPRFLHRHHAVSASHLWPLPLWPQSVSQSVSQTPKPVSAPLQRQLQRRGTPLGQSMTPHCCTPSGVSS
jgi:hypothetical protein